MKYDFIDIGCSIFDVSVDKYGLEANGILVEPVKEFIDVMPHSKTVLRENSAISFFNGESDFHVIIPEGQTLRYWSEKELEEDIKSNFIKQDAEYSPLLRPAHMGSSAFHDPTEYEFAQHLKSKKRVVKTITLKEFFNKYNVTEIEQLKIDCEGHDVFIVAQLINLMRAKSIKVNKLIFEFSDEHPFDKAKFIMQYLVLILEKEFNYNAKKIHPNDWSHDIELTLNKNGIN